LSNSILTEAGEIVSVSVGKTAKAVEGGNSAVNAAVGAILSTVGYVP
jgi:hypothetical protein